MELLFNDLSIHGQFHDVAEFATRINCVRKIADEFGGKLYFPYTTAYRPVDSSDSVQTRKTSTTFTHDDKRALLRLFDKQQRPFLHDSNQRLKCGDKSVNGYAVGEAAYCTNDGIDLRLVSLTPSDWEYSPITVTMEPDTATHLEVKNYWDPSELEAALQDAEPPIMSWSQLEAVSRAKFQCLQFSRECFRPLDGQPFVHGAAERIINRLDILNRLMESVDASGNRTEEGDQLYRAHLDRGNDRFSDSSKEEKIDFKQKLTFPHPGADGSFLFCPWHGKVSKSSPFRIHFSWPVAAGEPLYVVYVGPKLTKR